jgi:hypothetical protein
MENNIIHSLDRLKATRLMGLAERLAAIADRSDIPEDVQVN